MTLQDIKQETHITHQGYEGIGLGLDGRLYLVHRLIAEQNIPNPEGKRCVNHIDGNKLNNDLKNLEWATHAENTRHAFRTGIQHNHHPKPSRRKPVKTSDGREFASINIASESTGIIRTAIANCLSGRSQKAGGLKWQYL